MKRALNVDATVCSTCTCWPETGEWAYCQQARLCCRRLVVIQHRLWVWQEGDVCIGVVLVLSDVQDLSFCEYASRNNNSNKFICMFRVPWLPCCIFCTMWSAMLFNMDFGFDIHLWSLLKSLTAKWTPEVDWMPLCTVSVCKTAAIGEGWRVLQSLCRELASEIILYLVTRFVLHRVYDIMLY